MNEYCIYFLLMQWFETNMFYFNYPESESESEVAQSCPTLFDPMDCSISGFSVHGTFQARVLEWVAISFSRGSSRPRDWIQVSHIAGGFFTVWAIREAQLIHIPSANFLIIFSFSSVGKESAWNAGDLGLIPGLGGSSGEGNSNPLQYSCLENPMDREAWWATVDGVV